MPVSPPRDNSQSRRHQECYQLQTAQINNQLNSWRTRAFILSSLKAPGMEPVSCEDFLAGRPACRDRCQGKSDRWRLSPTGLWARKHESTLSILSLWVLISEFLQTRQSCRLGLLALAAAPFATRTRRARPPRTLRAEVKSEGRRGGDRRWSHYRVGRDRSL